MDFRKELAKWGYNKGNSVDVETLIDEILPELFLKQERSYSEEEVRNIANWAFGFYRRNDLSDSELEDDFNRILEEQFKKK
jgi:hypothetical protein